MSEPRGAVAEPVDFLALISSPTAAFEEGLAFFRGKGMINETLRKLAADLEGRGIDYAIVDSVALNRHGYRRFTEAIDVLLTPEGLERFRAELIGRGYRPAFEGARKKFRATDANVPVEVVTTGEYPGDGKPKPVRFPDPADAYEVIDGVRTLPLARLVELKLASGMTAAHRLKDLADVQELIRLRGLGAVFAEGLDPFVREKYLELHGAVALAGAWDEEEGNAGT